MIGEHFDSLETRAPAEREAELFARLPEVLANAVANAPGWARHLAGYDLSAVTSRADLARLPVLRKAELMAAQKERPPFGEFAVSGPAGFERVYMSPGPVFEPHGEGADPWSGARALFAAGLRPGDVVHNAFAYHMTPGGFILDHGARALGCAVFPAGVGNTEMQLQAISSLKPTAYTGTPDYLKVLLDKALEMKCDVSSITRGLVSGGALFPSLRQEYLERGVHMRQCYATAELGVIAYETMVDEGLIVSEGLIVEIVRPGTDDPVPDGEIGELVVTNFSAGYPMIRFGTGDLSAVAEGASRCGRTNIRIKGWMGRADQRTKVKGMFVDPKQIAELRARHPQVLNARLVIERRNEQDFMTLHYESEMMTPDFEMVLGESLRELTKLKGAVARAARGSLPKDGKVVSDERNYD